MERRGFTLLEVLVALGVVLALAAIAAPALLGRWRRAGLESAVAQVAAAAVECRARAQRDGEVMALSARPEGETWALFLEPIEPGAEERDGDGDPEGPRARRWGSLARGATLAESLEPAEGAARVDPSAGEASPVTIAIFLPDGTAAMQGPRYVRSGDEAAQLEINGWTGAMRARPAEPGAGPDGQETLVREVAGAT